MGEQIKSTGSELKNRWIQDMPPFFRGMVKLAIGVLVTAVVINFCLPALGAELYEWWPSVYTHILVACFCVIIVCKMTGAGGYKHIDIDKITHHRTILDKDDN